MRKFISAAVAGLAVAGAAGAIAGSAQAQPYGYYPAPSYYGNGYYNQPYYNQYRQPYSSYGYNNNYYGNDGLSNGLAVLGSVLGLNNGYGYNNSYRNVPVDRYGPDPNGMIAPDGHRIKCKLRSSYDNYYGRNVTRRECW